MVEIKQLTPEQIDKLDVYRDKWIKVGLKTGACDRGAVEAAVDLVYRCGGLAPPALKIWLRSPLEGRIASCILDQARDQVVRQVRSQVMNQVLDQVVSQVSDQVGRQVVNQVKRQVSDQVERQVKRQVSDQVVSQVSAQVGDQVLGLVSAQVERQLGSPVVKIGGYGCHDANWLGFYEYMFDVLHITGAEKLKGLFALAQAGCGWWWPFTDVVVLTEPPAILTRDDQHRLHHESGPALQYSDGFAVYCWHGTRVPADIIEHPEDITTQRVMQEQNQEIRRVMLERYGWMRLLQELGAVKLHHDGYGTLYETNRLGEYLDGEDPLAHFVRVICPSTGREYVLRVPPDTTTAQAAVARTFDIDVTKEQYAPEQET